MGLQLGTVVGGYGISVSRGGEEIFVSIGVLCSCRISVCIHNATHSLLHNKRLNYSRSFSTWPFWTECAADLIESTNWGEGYRSCVGYNKALVTVHHHPLFDNAAATTTPLSAMFLLMRSREARLKSFARRAEYLHTSSCDRAACCQQDIYDATSGRFSTAPIYYHED
jgi:hypothetical protein